MSPASRLAALALAAVAVTATGFPALAATAYASTTLNVRSCGSTSCGVIDVLRRGEPVEVRLCEGVWCQVGKAGPDGWVNANYLERERGYDDDPYYDDDYYYDPPPRRIYPPYPRRPFYRYDPGFSACIGGPNARFCVYD